MISKIRNFISQIVDGGREKSLFFDGKLACILIVSYQVFLFCIKIIPYSSNQNLYLFAYVLIVLMPVCFVLSRRISLKFKLKNQSTRDSIDIKSKRNCLLLRSFSADKELELPNPIFFKDYPTHRFRLGLEEFVGKALEPVVVLQFLGESSTVGNTRIYPPDSSWKKEFIFNIKNMNYVVIVPLIFKDSKTKITSGLSVIWEFKMLIKLEKLYKTLVLMPCSSWFRYNVRSSWELAREQLAKISLFLPPYSHSGAVLMPVVTKTGVTFENIIKSRWWKSNGILIGEGLNIGINHIDNCGG